MTSNLYVLHLISDEVEERETSRTSRKTVDNIMKNATESADTFSILNVRKACTACLSIFSWCVSSKQSETTLHFENQQSN
jgi:hypothetical protein